MGAVLFRLLVGGAVGFLVWMVREPSAPGLGPSFGTWEAVTLLVFGAALGAALGALEGYVRRGLRFMLVSALIGMVTGAVGVTFGSLIGTVITRSIFGAAAFGGLSAWPARVMAFVPIGLLLGAGVGAAQLSWPRIKQGAIGGLLGGAITGAVFDPIGQVFGVAMLISQGLKQGEVGAIPRAIFFTALGASIGMMIGIVAQVSRTAWLRHSVGRNESREWDIDKGRTVIGRDERADVPLFGDPSVQPYHAVIDRVNPNQYVLQAAPGAPVTLNGQPVGPPAMLAEGSQIGVGGTMLTFHLRGRKPVAAPTLASAAFLDPVTAAPASAPSYSARAAVLASPPLTLPAVPRAMIKEGPLTGRTVTFDHPTEVGREAELALAGDAQASRRHARFIPEGTGLRVEDLGSTNGVLVNGQKVPSATLHPGDQVRIGGTVFEILPTIQ